MRRILLVALAGWLAAPTCQAPHATVRFEPAAINLAQGGFLVAEVVVETASGVRAWELDVVSDDPGVARVVGIAPHADFDDDGTLFQLATVDPALGEARDAVDLRHGGAAATGTFGIATVYVSASAPGTTTVRIDGGGMASDGGAAFSVSGQTLSVSVTP